MKIIHKIPLMICIAALLAACTRPSSNTAAPTATLDLGLVSTIAAMTLEAYASSTVAAALPSATTALTPTVTLTVTITPTFEAPMLQFTGNTNCRKGPGTEYEVSTVLLSGQKVEAMGVAQSGNYWLVKNPDGENCWVAKDFVDASGSVQALPTVMAPPTPTPVPPNAPAWASYTYTCDFASGGNNLTMNLAWTDRSNNEEGYIVYRDDQPVITLGADASSYVDIGFVATGKMLRYRVEAFSKAGEGQQQHDRGRVPMTEADWQAEARIELLRLLTARLERLSVDSIWARRASGLRGSLIKALESIGTSEPVSRENLDMLIERSFEILRNAAREIPDAEAQWRKLRGQ